MAGATVVEAIVAVEATTVEEVEVGAVAAVPTITMLMKRS